MNLTQFQELSMRTMPFGGITSNQIEFENMLGNYSIGLVGESVEVLQATRCNLAYKDNSINLIKELGDVLHYAVGLKTLYKLNFNESYGQSDLDVYETVELMLFEAKNISEFAKKHIYHRHNDAFPYKNLDLIIDCVVFVAESLGYTLGEVMQMNIDKLKTRYPDKFNTVDSIARKDVTND